MARKIQVYNFKSGETTIVDSLEEAVKLTGKSKKDIRHQLTTDNLRVHELYDMIVEGNLPEITKAIITKTQSYEFRYAHEFVIQLIECVYNPDGTYVLTNRVHEFATITEAANFLGSSRQSLYNRKGKGNTTPLRGMDGEYYMVNFGDSEIKELIVDGDTAGTELYVLRTTTTSGEDTNHTYKTSGNIKDLYIHLVKNSPIKVLMPYTEFYLTCKALSPVPEKYKEAFQDGKYFWMETITNDPSACTYGVPITYDFLGIGRDMFSNGCVIARII